MPAPPARQAIRIGAGTSNATSPPAREPIPAFWTPFTIPRSHSSAVLVAAHEAVSCSVSCSSGQSRLRGGVPSRGSRLGHADQSSASRDRAHQTQQIVLQPVCGPCDSCVGRCALVSSSKVLLASVRPWPRPAPVQADRHTDRVRIFLQSSTARPRPTAAPAAAFVDTVRPTCFHRSLSRAWFVRSEAKPEAFDRLSAASST